MSEANGKVCCNCRHNIRYRQLGKFVECRCEIDDHYIGYVECFEHWCRHWAITHAFDDVESENKTE